MRVFNTAQEGSVDGPQQNDGERMPFLKAIIPDPEETSKLMVGPPFLPEVSACGRLECVAAGAED